METNEDSELISDLKSISNIIEDDCPYTQQITETFKVDIIQFDGIKVIISHEKYNRSNIEEWKVFAKSVRETHFFKEYNREIKKILKKHNYRSYISKNDGLEIRIIKK